MTLSSNLSRRDALIEGISVDVDQAFAADFGQWDLPR